MLYFIIIHQNSSTLFIQGSLPCHDNVAINWSQISKYRGSPATDTRQKESIASQVKHKFLNLFSCTMLFLLLYVQNRTS